MNPQRPSHNHSDTSSWMTLRRVCGARYYRMHLEQDLWNEWLVTQVYGHVGSRLGQARALPAASIESALLQIAALAKRRRQRGYELMN